MNAQNLLHPQDSDREWLQDEDFKLADKQLQCGISEDIVVRRLRDWAATYRYESECFNAEIDHLHAEQ